MARISRARAHSLSAADARQRVERIAAKLTDRFGAVCEWRSETVLAVTHPSVNGTLVLGSADVRLDAELGFPVSLMRAQVEAEVDRLMERELAG